MLHRSSWSLVLWFFAGNDISVAEEVAAVPVGAQAAAAAAAAVASTRAHLDYLHPTRARHTTLRNLSCPYPADQPLLRLQQWRVHRAPLGHPLCILVAPCIVLVLAAAAAAAELTSFPTKITKPK